MTCTPQVVFDSEASYASSVADLKSLGSPQPFRTVSYRFPPVYRPFRVRFSTVSCPFFTVYFLPH
jgi:hypothetical protein